MNKTPTASHHSPATEKSFTTRKRIMIVDDHPLMRAGLAQLIHDQSDMEVCCEAGTAAEAIGKLSGAHPDLIVADITMPGRSGIEFVKDLHALDPNAAILVLSMQDEALYAERALRAGARGYIMKETGAKVLLDAMRHVLAGEVYVSPAISVKVLETLHAGRPLGSEGAIAQLTDREFEIFQLIGQGMDTQEISRMLNLSRRTIDVHRASLKRKFGLSSGTSLVRHAVHWFEKRRHGNGH